MKRYEVDRIACRYESRAGEVFAIVTFQRIDRVSCLDRARTYLVTSSERMTTLSTVANLCFSEVATLPNGWVAFMV